MATEFFLDTIFYVAALIGSPLLLQWAIKGLIYLINPIQYWLVASFYFKDNWIFQLTVLALALTVIT